MARIQRSFPSNNNLRIIRKEGTPAVAFDAALMAAINQPQHLIVYHKPKVTASGMKPPNIVNN